MNIDENNINDENIQEEDNGQQEVKTFTQEEVNLIVQERLKRESKKYADHEDLSELANILDDFDYGNLSLKEKKELLKQQADEYKKSKIKQEADEKNIPEDILAEIKELKRITDSYKEKEEKENIKLQEEAAAKEKLQNDINEFYQKYPKIDLNSLATSDDKFKKFLNRRSNKGLSLIEVYEDFIDIYGNNSSEEKAKINNQRGTLGGGNNVGASNFHGLTQAQRNLADEAGMTYERYAGILKKCL
jgi:hypothetical protein